MHNNKDVSGKTNSRRESWEESNLQPSVLFYPSQRKEVTLTLKQKDERRTQLTRRDCHCEFPIPVGPLATYKDAPNLTEIVRLNPGLEPGGHYHPAHCRARHRVAVVVPYRDRQQHLRVLLHNLHPMLMRQQLDYFILVVELVRSFGVFS